MCYEYYGRKELHLKRQEIRCPRCKGAGRLLWPNDIGTGQIDGDVVMSMLDAVHDKMYADLLQEGKIDGVIPAEHFPTLQLWELRHGK